MNEGLILSNVCIFNSGENRFSSPQNVAILDGVIQKISRFDLNEYSGLQSVDCQGRFAIPGLWECHAHLSPYLADDPEFRKEILSESDQGPEISWDVFVQNQLQDFLNRGITHIRDVGGPLDKLKDLSHQIQTGKIQGPDLFYAGPMLEKPPLVWEKENRTFPGFTVPIDTPEAAVKMLDRLHEHGASLVKTFNKFDRNSYEALVDRAREYHLPVTHDPGGMLYHWIPMDYAMEQGISCFEHAKSPLPVILNPSWKAEHDALIQSPPENEENRAFLRKILLNLEDSIHMNRLDELCREMVDRNVCFCPTLHTLLSVKKVMDTAPADEKEAFRRQVNHGYFEMNRLIMDAMIAQGVKILVGHDGPDSDGTLEEMELLAEWGLKPVDIIKGATRYPSQWLQVADRYGDIIETKAADLVILNQDPLLNISNIRTVWAIYHRNKWMLANPSPAA